MLNIEITDDYLVTITRKKPNGRKESSLISINQLKEVIEFGVEENNKRKRKENVNMLSSGVFPSLEGYKTVFYDIALDESESVIGVLVQNKRYDLKYLNNTVAFYDCLVPDTLFIFNLTGKRIQRVSVFCVLDKFISKDTMLYSMPFGNVYGDGNICWGGNHVFNLDLEDTNTLVRAIGIFYNSPFLDHNYNKVAGLAQRKLFETLTGAQSIPDFIVEDIKKKPKGTLAEVRKNKININ